MGEVPSVMFTDGGKYVDGSCLNDAENMTLGDADP